MKKIQAFLLLLACVLLGFSGGLRAEDVDIYVDNAANSDAPNVLFVIDNSANFSANVKIGCATYKGTNTPPSLGTSTAAGIVQCALVDAINTLPDGAMNIGILMGNASNFATTSPAEGTAGHHELCMDTGVGGCLLKKPILITGTDRTKLINFIKGWKINEGDASSADGFNIKIQSAPTASMMQEAWAFYNGKIGMSGKNYATSILQTGCQRNFVIFIANTEKTPPSEKPSPYDPPYGLSSAQVNAAPDQLEKIKEPVYFATPTCKKSVMEPGNQSSDWSENWADEWARLMAEQDRGLEIQDGTQNIVTYTIGITNDATCSPEYPALLSTMATYGRGKFFKVSDASQMMDALASALNEVQAVNSVFSSASLPVSVNAEGSYLNQIFLGMFRPDSSANPRWMGNLKQYQLIRGQTGSLVLGDAKGLPAISSAGTGFIAPTAQSYWTYKNTAVEPDLSGGFFRKDLKGTPASGYDAADGEVVEKGGVAQQLRKENLKAAFGSTDPAANPRRLFTYCPSGPLDTTCIDDLRNAANAFTAANTAIPANAFGKSTTVAIRSIVRTGTTATVTTYGNHGFKEGTVVTITNVSQSAYNGTWTLGASDIPSASTFLIGGLSDNPPTPTQGSFTISSAATGAVGVAKIVRNVSSTAASEELVTVTTSMPHGFTATTKIQILGATPQEYNYTGVPTAVTSTTTFTFKVKILPSPSVTGYQVNLSPTAHPAIPSTTVSNPSSNKISGNTGKVKHEFHVGQLVTIYSSSKNSKYPGTYKVTGTPTEFTFTADASGHNITNASLESVTVAPDNSPQPIITLGRNGTGKDTIATATGLPANFFGVQDGDTKVVNISKVSGAVPAAEAAYALSGVTITCKNDGCTTFTYPITVSPSPDVTGSSITAGLQGSAVATLPTISRTGGTATASITMPPSATQFFTSGDVVNISANSSAYPAELAYAGQWKISCSTSPCTTITFGPIPQTPATPATGINMQAFSATTSPDRETVVRWVRGENIQGDEQAPQADITVRPSIHGDVLHSRPVVLNYGDGRIVVYYGANDGIFRAVNGNQTGSITGPGGESVPPGGELWGLLLQEHFDYYDRLRLNSPELKFPSTILKTAKTKDYFIDGPTGVMQKLDVNGRIEKAYLYLTMRRGGRFMYAVDVSNPATPTIKWRRSALNTGFEELGQTWSRPRLTLVQGSSTPVIVFGGGYDPAQDDEAPTANSSGRAIYVVNAETGDLIWRAQLSCPASTVTATTEAGGLTLDSSCHGVGNMAYPIPSEIAFVDRDVNGRTDKFYFGDTGGNVWRADVASAKTSEWKVTRVAALGCDDGACPSGTTPRKFFYPPAVLSIRPAGDAASYEAISLTSGDREHPLLDTTNPESAYNTSDMFFMIKDVGTTVGAPDGAPKTVDVDLRDLVNARELNTTNTTWNGSGGGFYIGFGTGEKAVNAPLAVNGQVFFSTNQPIPRDETCVANLGQARAYAVSPFDGRSVSNVLQGGGMPPSAVAGLILVDDPNSDNPADQILEKFCIGCGTAGLDPTPGTPPCNSALENCNIGKSIPKNLKRTYWYKK